MSAVIIDGRVLRERLMPELLALAKELRERHRCVPSLAAILVGKDPASRQYIRNKERMAADLGFQSQVFALDPADCTTDSLLRVIGELNTDGRTTGILIQLPLPDPV